MKVAIYARVSTGLQATEGTSLEGQIDLCINKARLLNLSNIEVYKEGGASGEDIDRPEMNRLRQDIIEGKVSDVICVHPDRLSRDMTDKLIVCREFEKYDVNLIFCDTEYKDTPEGQLFFNLQSSIAQYELAMIRKRTSRGRINAVQKQNKVMPMRVAPYGYDLIDAALVVNEKEAEHVQKIYSWYVYDRLTLREIGDKLVGLGAVPKRKESKNWHQSSISRILTSEIYIGNYWYNKRKTQKIKGQKGKNGNPKKTYELRDKAEWIKNTVPAIIDQGLYDLAQDQRQRNQTNSGNVKHQYLLKGLIRCAHCGRKWNGTTYSGRVNKNTGQKIRYRCYRCPNKNPKKYGTDIEKCMTKTLRAEIIEEYIWNLVLQTIVNPVEIEMQFQQTARRVDSQIQDEMDALESRINEKQKEREKIKRMFLSEVIKEEEAFRDIGELNGQVELLQKELNELKEHLEQNRKNKEANEQAKLAIEHLRKLVKKEIDIPLEKKKGIIETLIEEIIISFRDNSKCEVTCIGYLDTLIQSNDLVLSLQHEEV